MTPPHPAMPAGSGPARPDDQTPVPDRRLGWVKAAAYLVLALSLLAFVIKGANSPADPELVGEGDEQGAPGDGSRTGLAGFGEVAITVHPGDGTALLQWCLLLAASEQQRQQGLMTVTDPALGGYDGMLFRYDSDVSVGFYMRNTPMPLSIAYIDGAGRIVSTADMAPCADVDGCPTYPPAGPFRWALEVPQGGLARLGLVGAATFTDTGATCPA